MTPETRELPPVTHRAGLQVELRVRAAVGVQKIRRMVRGLQLRSFDVTEPAANRRVDLVVADETIGHRQERRLRRTVGIVDAVMARQTRIVGVEAAAQIAGRRQIGPIVDRGRNHRRDVAQLEVRLVTERLQLRNLSLLSESPGRDAEQDQPLYEMRQIFLRPSSLTRMLPSGSCMSATGRPQTSFESGAIIQPARKSRTPPLGLPFANGTNATE